VSYRDRQRLSDIQAAIEAIHSHLQRGDLSDGLVFDAVRIRLLEIGEAVKALPDDLLATQPSIPWRQIARMRDHLAHRYFDTAHAILQATVDEDLPDLERAVAPWPIPCPQKTRTPILAWRDPTHSHLKPLPGPRTYARARDKPRRYRPSTRAAVESIACHRGPRSRFS
jgi:uncharacterized protein with HEPN domain